MKIIKKGNVYKKGNWFKRNADMLFTLLCVILGIFFFIFAYLIGV